MPRLPDALWARAERFLPARLRPLMDAAELRPHWLDDRHFRYQRGAQFFRVDAETGNQEEIPPPESPPGKVQGELPSPDGRSVLFTRENNLWLRDAATGAERDLTRDGAPNHAYAKSADMNLTTVTLARKGISATPAALWSPDSARILTVRLDERAIGDFPMVQHVPEDGSARPLLWNLKVALAGDAALPTLEYIVIEAASGAIT